MCVCLCVYVCVCVRYVCVVRWSMYECQYERLCFCVFVFIFGISNFFLFIASTSICTINSIFSLFSLTFLTFSFLSFHPSFSPSFIFPPLMPSFLSLYSPLLYFRIKLTSPEHLAIVGRSAGVRQYVSESVCIRDCVCVCVCVCK